MKKQASFRMEIEAIRTWEEMKQGMSRHFVPSNYKQMVHHQFRHVRQENKTIEEYTNSKT